MKVRAFTELSNLPGSRDTEVMGDSEILEAIKINTRLSSASWKDDWKSCYFDFSQFHLLSLSPGSTLHHPLHSWTNLLLLASAWLCGQCYKFNSFRNKPIFSRTQPYLCVFTVMFSPLPCPINHQGLAVFLEWYSEWSPDQESSWDLIRNANSWPLQTYLNQEHWSWGLAICVLKSLQVVLLHAQAWPSLP